MPGKELDIVCISFHPCFCPSLIRAIPVKYLWWGGGRGSSKNVKKQLALYLLKIIPFSTLYHQYIIPFSILDPRKKFSLPLYGFFTGIALGPYIMVRPTGLNYHKHLCWTITNFVRSIIAFARYCWLLSLSINFARFFISKWANPLLQAATLAVPAASSDREPTPLPLSELAPAPTDLFGKLMWRVWVSN